MPLFLALMLRALSSSSISSTSTEHALAFGTIATLIVIGFRARVSFFLVLTSGTVFEGSIPAICKVSISNRFECSIPRDRRY